MNQTSFSTTDHVKTCVFTVVLMTVKRSSDLSTEKLN